jgi:GT2 family glycosyltransferase
LKLSVIIVNYNVRYFLEQCIISVQKAMRAIDAEIIIVDNNSTDESCVMVKDNFPHITLIENKENVGFSTANNQARWHQAGHWGLGECRIALGATSTRV